MLTGWSLRLFKMAAFEKFLKAVITAVCFSSSIFLMIDVWEKYSRETTNTGIRIQYATKPEKARKSQQTLNLL